MFVNPQKIKIIKLCVYDQLMDILAGWLKSVVLKF